MILMARMGRFALGKDSIRADDVGASYSSSGVTGVARGGRTPGKS